MDEPIGENSLAPSVLLEKTQWLKNKAVIGRIAWVINPKVTIDIGNNRLSQRLFLFRQLLMPRFPVVEHQIGLFKTVPSRLRTHMTIICLILHDKQVPIWAWTTYFFMVPIVISFIWVKLRLLLAFPELRTGGVVGFACR